MFYGNAYLYLALGVLITFIGFFPSYFKLLGQTDRSHHFHGITATLWMLLMVAQPWLYRQGRLKLHRSLGWASLALAPLIVLGGLRMMQIMVLDKERYGEYLGYQLAFIDAFTLIVFAVFFGLGIHHRKNLQLHARYMVATIFGPLLPALTRVFNNSGWTDSFNGSLTISCIIFELVLIALILDDRRKGRIRLPYVLFLGLFIMQHLMMYSAGGWAWWRACMDAFAQIGA